MERTVVPATVYHATLCGDVRPREMASLDERLDMLAYDPPYEPKTNEFREVYLEDVHRSHEIYYSHNLAPNLYHPQPPREHIPDRSDEPAYAWYIYRKTGSHIEAGKALGIDRCMARTRCAQYINRIGVGAGLPARSRKDISIPRPARST